MLLLNISLILQTKGITSSSTVYLYIQQLGCRPALLKTVFKFDAILYVQSSSGGRDYTTIVLQWEEFIPL